MAHFARIDSNIVTQVIVVSNDVLENKEYPESESIGVQFIQSLGLGTNWKQTSYNNNFRTKYAGLGDTYNEELDLFESPVYEELVEE